MKYDYDVIILGSGPAGFACAMQASKFDKKALVVETNPKYLGGTWINTGTVPSKALREAASKIYEFDKQFGNNDGSKPYERYKMRDLLQYKDKILENENRRVKNDLIKNKVDTVRGFGVVEDEHTIKVTDHLGKSSTYSASFIFIATGSSPTPPQDFEVDNDKIFDTQSILDLTHIPRRLVIVGAGVNAFEYATIFAALGTRVTILNSEDDYLPFLDHEIHDEIPDILDELQIGVKNNVTLKDVGFNPLRVCTEVRYSHQDDHDELKVLETEHVLYIRGRQPNTGKLQLDHANVTTTDNGSIQVDDHYKTSCDSIYAAGDVIGFPSLASASFSQGRLAACHMFEVDVMKEPKEIPFGIYSIPEIAHIGLTEEKAKEAGYEVTVGRAYFEHTTQADISNKTKGLLKLVFETKSFQLLGVHILGEQACDLLHLGQAVMAMDGDIRYFIQHVLNYPTFGEAYRTAAFNGINRVYKAGVKYKNLLKK